MGFMQKLFLDLNTPSYKISVGIEKVTFALASINKTKKLFIFLFSQPNVSADYLTYGCY